MIRRTLIGALVVALLGLVAPMALAKKLTFRVKLDITKGKYLSTWNCECSSSYGGFHTLEETDEGFAVTATYKGLTIPASGRAVMPGRPLIVKTLQWDALGDWSLGGTYWTQDNPNAPINCTGILAPADDQPVEIFSAPGNSSSELKLYVEGARTNADEATFKPVSVDGTNCDSVNAEKWHAFWPASWADNGLAVQDMFTVDVRIPLHELRKMHVGDVWGLGFHQGKAKRIPPHDCSLAAGGGWCTQSLTWTGELSFTRTG